MALDRNVVRWFKSFGYLTLTCLCFLLVQSQYAFGQVDEGSITGTVQDTTGAVVAGAEVTLVNTDQGITLQTRTNGSGEYTFSPVRIGHYTVSVTAKGFAKTTQKNLEVAVSQQLLVNVQLSCRRAERECSASQRAQLYLPGPVGSRHANAASRHPRQCRLWRLFRQWTAPGAKQLPP